MAVEAVMGCVQMLNWAWVFYQRLENQKKSIDPAAVKFFSLSS